MTPAELETVDKATTEVSALVCLARSVSTLMRRAIGEPDDDLATLAVCELVMDQVGDRLNAIESALTIMKVASA